MAGSSSDGLGGHAAAAAAPGARRPWLGLPLWLRRPDWASLVVVGLLYSNAVVVAIKFHGLPLLAGAALPALLLLPIAHYVLLRRQSVVMGPEVPAVLAWFAFMAVAALCSRDPGRSLGVVQEYALEGLFLYLLVTNAIRRVRVLRPLAWSLLAAGVVMTAAPVVQQLTGTFDHVYGGFGQLEERPFTIASGTAQHRLAGTIGEKNRFAQITMLLLPVALYLCWSARRRVPRLLAYGATVTILGGFALAFSRGAAVAAVMLFMVAIALRMISMRQTLGLVAAGGLLLLATPQYLQRLSELPVVSSVVWGKEAKPDGAVRGRLTEMLAAVHVCADHPVVGVGPGMFADYSQEYGNRLNIRRLDNERQAHNLYLHIAAESGFLGLGAFLALVGVTLGRLARLRQRWLPTHPEHAALCSAFGMMVLAYLATGLFLHLTYVRYFWLMMALAAAVANVLDPDTRRSWRRMRPAA
ncbi:MAG: O-antigen ligase family protein [Planctomycetota bacterium]